MGFNLALLSAVLAITAGKAYVDAHNHDAMVAFMCRKPSMHLTSEGWKADKDTDCLHDPIDILNYCQKIYPNRAINNIVPARKKVLIKNWCRAGRKHCLISEHSVQAYKCLEGPFQSDALLVPEHCLFDHIHRAEQCKDPNAWNKTASSACDNRSMKVDSFAILLPCGVDLFSGVEFVCCPKNNLVLGDDFEDSSEEISNEDSSAEEYSSEEEDDDSFQSNEIGDESMTSSEMQRNRIMEQEERSRQKKKESHRAAKAAKKLHGNQVLHENSIALSLDKESDTAYTTYLHNKGRGGNEHSLFMKAKDDLLKHHHGRVTKMMKEWASARQRVQDMKASDRKAAEKLNKEITARFQKTYQALEQEGQAEKVQLLALHQQRVQANYNEKKRHAMEAYMSSLQKHQPESSHVLKTLKHYIKVEQKDRLHTANHFQRIRETEPIQAQNMRQQTLDHLAVIDTRINQSINMLSRVPQFTSKIKTEIHEFLKTFHDIDVSIADIMVRPTEKSLSMQTEEDSESYEDESYEDESYEDDDDDIGDVDDAEENNFSHESEESEADTNKERTSIKSIVEPIVERQEAKPQPAVTETFHKHAVMHDDEAEVHRVHLLDSSQIKVTKYDDATDDLPQAAHFQSSRIHRDSTSMQKMALTNSQGSLSAFGIAVGTIAVVAIIIAGIVGLKKRASSRSHISHGFVEVDTTSPEERHVANMQMNGYENPTYKYFDANPQLEKA